MRYYFLMPAKLTSKLTSKYQATFPTAVRAKLGVRSGDAVQFVIRKDEVVVRKADPLDPGFLALATEAFSDWNTPAADEAFKDL
jgi:AbrB family looped-hinge helix DNA binding protein